MKELAIVTLSGGVDSCVSAAVANEKYELAFIHFNYGQRTEKKELQSFHEIADYYDVQKRLVVDLFHLAKIGGSSLTDKNISVPEADLNSSSVPNSYVPFRNANILTAAVSWGEVIGAKAIFMGAVYEDSSGYPDCKPSFFDAFNKVIENGTKPDTQIKIETPIINLNKSEIIKKGIELNAPMHLTWSCYKNEEEACGVCDSCALRLRGFQLAGAEDQIPYQVKPDYVK